MRTLPFMLLVTAIMRERIQKYQFITGPKEGTFFSLHHYIGRYCEGSVQGSICQLTLAFAKELDFTLYTN